MMVDIERASKPARGVKEGQAHVLILVQGEQEAHPASNIPQTESIRRDLHASAALPITDDQSVKTHSAKLQWVSGIEECQRCCPGWG